MNTSNENGSRKYEGRDYPPQSSTDEWVSHLIKALRELEGISTATEFTDDGWKRIGAAEQLLRQAMRLGGGA